MLTKKIKTASLLSFFCLLSFNISSQVILYENVNLSGRSKALNEGNFRFFTPADFNDVTSSIKVPVGMYVTVFEHADEEGGYGISVDLMEDCKDLSIYNFNKKISFVSVTKLPQKTGFIWVRGTMQNGQYIPPHWERARANGSSPNTSTAVVAPPKVSNKMRQLLTGKKVIINMATGKVFDVKGGSTAVGGQIWTYNSNNTISQFFTFNEDFKGYFNIKTKDNYLISVKEDLVLSDGSVSSGRSGRIVVQDNPYQPSRNCDLGLFNATCPLQQSWNIMPVPNETLAFYIENVASRQLLQPTSAESGAALILANNNNSNIQKWRIVETSDLLASQTATPEDIAQFNDIVQNQIGVGVLNGESTKPFYFHHNQDGESIYKYKKQIVGGADLDAWFPVEEYRKTLCGTVKEYKFCTQDFWHDSPVNSDKDINLHIVPDPKFSYLLNNPRFISYANGDYYRKRVSAYCLTYATATFNCNNNAQIKKMAETKARADADELLREIKWDNIEVEFTPNTALSANDHRPMNGMLAFTEGSPIKNFENSNEKICAYGPWMWERILYSDWPIVGIFKDAHFNNEIHPANQLWFKYNNALHLISIVDQTGYYEKKNDIEVEASGINQKMRYHIAFEIPNALTSSALTQFTTSGIIHDKDNNNTTPRGNIVNSEVILKVGGLPNFKFSITHNERFKTHNAFVDKVRLRPDGTLQGYLVVETVPITNRGGTINVIVIKK